MYRPPYNLDCWKTRKIDLVSLLSELRRSKLRIGFLISPPWVSYHQPERQPTDFVPLLQTISRYIGNHIVSASRTSSL
jgi:hypothetical protein